MTLYEGNTSYNTFPLLWCESCGKAEEPPQRPRLPDFVADPFLECLATLESLPDRYGRWPT